MPGAQGWGTRVAGALRRAAVLAAVAALAGAAPPAGDDQGSGEGSAVPGRGELEAIVGSLTGDVFVGKGLTGQLQRFHVPGSGLTVSAPGEDPVTVTSGNSDLEASAPVDPSQVQPVGSNTKVATAVLVMQLVEAGRLRLDSKLPAVAAANQEDGGTLRRFVRTHGSRLREVTIRENLNHTSGLADCLDAPAFFKAFERNPLGDYSLEQLAAYGVEAKPVFRPGAPGEWNYSNTDYMLLGMVIEAVTGQSVDAAMEKLFEQAGMKTAYFAPDPQQMRTMAGAGSLARGYMPNPPTPPPVPALFDAFEGAPEVDSALHPQRVELVRTGPGLSSGSVGLETAPPGHAARVERQSVFSFTDVTSAYSLSIGQTAGGIVTTSAGLERFWRSLFDGTLVEPSTLREMQRTVPVSRAGGVTTTWGAGFGHQVIDAGVLYPGSPEVEVWMHQGDIFGWASSAYFVEGSGLVIANTINHFPLPEGDLGVLREVIRASA